MADRMMDILPAKTLKGTQKYLPVAAHARDAAGVMEKVIKLLPDSTFNALKLSKEEAKRLLVFLSCVHDVGKMTADFQNKILRNVPVLKAKVEKEVEVPHVELLAGVGHAWEGEAILNLLGCPPSVSAIIGMHHGVPFQNDGTRRIFSKSLCRNFGNMFSGGADDRWMQAWEEMLTEALQISRYNSVKDLPEVIREDAVVLSGIVIMADWIASNEEWFPLVEDGEAVNEKAYPERIEKGWNKLKMAETWQPCTSEMNEELFERRFGFTPNEMQRKTLELVNVNKKPGLLIIEAGMGSGKTEAAFAAAEVMASKSGAGGIFFGLPTQATANGLFPRLKHWAESQTENYVFSILLAHGNAEAEENFQELLNEDYRTTEEGLTVHPWTEGKHKKLLADFVCGTVDQVLQMALAQKFLSLLHVGITGKVVVIDEVHAYDAYMNGYLEKTLRWLGFYHVPVILLSATLPSDKRKHFVEAYTGKEFICDKQEYPLITLVTAEDTLMQKSVETHEKKEVKIEKITDTDILPKLSEKAQKGACTGIVVNTVARAQKMYDFLKEKLPDNRIILLHSRYISCDRSEKEGEILAKAGKHSAADERKGLIVIGTQVIEQSLDLDFDYMISDLCPADFLLQRIGRLHRHNRIRPQEASSPVISVIASENRGSTAVYGEYLLERTRNILPEKLILPQDIPSFVNSVYCPEENTLSEKESQLYHEFLNKTMIRRKQSEAFQIPSPSGSTRSLDDWIAIHQGKDEERALASVRGTKMSVEAVLIVKKEEKFYLLSDFPSSTPVTQDNSAQIALSKFSGNKIRFPEKCHKDILELQETSEECKFLRSIPRFSRFNFLVLSVSFSAESERFIFRYSREKGLEIIPKSTCDIPE